MAGGSASAQASIVDARKPSREPAFVPDRPPRFPPLVDATIARFIEMERDRLAGLVARYGSPLNIVWPHTVARNVGAITQVLDAQEIDYEIFYGAKVNKSKALVRAAVDAGVGIDVSSLAEFEDRAIEAASVNPVIDEVMPKEAAAEAFRSLRRSRRRGCARDREQGVRKGTARALSKRACHNRHWPCGIPRSVT